MRVLVCGGRDYADRAAVYKALDGYWQAAPMDTMIVIQGGAKGADAIARDWAAERSVECINVPADWNTFGLKAGPLRNQKMITKYRPAVVLAFPGGKGTSDIVTRAKIAGIEVVEPERCEHPEKSRPILTEIDIARLCGGRSAVGLGE